MVSRLLAHPSLLIPLFGVFVFLTVLCVLASVALTVAVMTAFRLDDMIAELLFFLFFAASVVALGLYYLGLVVFVFVRNAKIEGDFGKALRILETLTLIIFVFAVFYYFLQVFSENQAFPKMAHAPVPDLGRWDHPGREFEKRITTTPTFPVIVDCVLCHHLRW